MKKVFISIVLLFSINAFCQNQAVIDSLENRIAQSDISKLDKAKLYYNIALEYYDYNNKMALKYLDKAENLFIQQSVTDDNIIAKILSSKGWIYNNQYKLNESDSVYHKAIHTAQKFKGNDKLHYTIKAREGLALNLYYKGELDSALSLYTKLEDNAKSIDSTIFINQKLKSVIFENKAIVLATQGKFNKALIYFEKSVDIINKYYKNKPELVSIYINIQNNIAFCYSLQKKYNQAINTYIESLTLAKEYKLQKKINNIITNLGNLFLLTNNIEKCIYYSKQVVNDSSYAAYSAHNNLGVAYASSNHYIQSLNEHRKALGISMFIQNPKYIAKSHINIAIVFSNINKPDSMLFHINKVKNILQQHPNKNITNMLYEVEGRYFFRIKNYNNALLYFSKAIMNNKNQNSISEQHFRSANYLYMTYQKLQNSPKALFWIEKRDSIRFKLDSIYLSNKIFDIETKYQSSQKEAKILKLSNENLKKETELIKTRNTFYIILSLLITIIGLMFLFWYKRKQRIKLDLLEMNLKAGEKEKIRIGKELHDGIASNIIKLIYETENNDIELSDKLLKTYHKVRNLSHELNNTPMHNDLLFDQLIEIIPTNTEDKVFSLSINPKDLSLNEPYGTHLFRIIQELITNNLKHAKATKTQIIIQLKGEILSVKYNDDGIGIPIIKKGNGFKNIEDRVIVMNGKLTFINNIKKGFGLEIQIPKK